VKTTDNAPAAPAFRVAIYARYSSEMQNEISLEDQVSLCREEIARRGWRVAGIYTDSARSGWSLDRDGFQEFRAAAEKGRFDAAMFWKFDRLARDHNHTVMIKALLRHQYGLKLFCVEGVSEDDDDSPYTALVEQMIAVFAAFYSRNLSSDTKRAKRARAMRGEYNGSIAPIGYTLVTKKQAREDLPPGLHIDPDVAPLIAEAFKRYATGGYSDRTIAEWLNEQPAIQQHCEGRRPVGKEMVRDMLQNRTYTGRVSYAETIYDGASLGQRRRSSRKRKEWFEGRHEAIIGDEMYEACQAVREKMASTRKTEFQSRTYILPDRVFCAHCIAREHDNVGDPYYGKMRISWHNRDQVGHYRCVSRDRGFGECEQPYVTEDVVIDQLVEILSEMHVPPEALERIDEAVRSRMGNEEVLVQIAELEEQQRRVQFSWEHGRLTPEEYLLKTSQLEREIASLRPLDYDRLEEAADLITHFKSYWDQCAGLDEPREARQQLMAKIIDRVFLYNDSVIAVALYPDFGVVLDVPHAAPDQILAAVAQNQKGYNPSELYPVRERRASTSRWARLSGRRLSAFITS
jgi:DNA invertase Pin-like site-specific DNA recombinase